LRRTMEPLSARRRATLVEVAPGRSSLAPATNALQDGGHSWRGVSGGPARGHSALAPVDGPARRKRSRCSFFFFFFFFLFFLARTAGLHRQALEGGRTASGPEAAASARRATTSTPGRRSAVRVAATRGGAPPRPTTGGQPRRGRNRDSRSRSQTRAAFGPGRTDRFATIPAFRPDRGLRLRVGGRLHHSGGRSDVAIIRRREANQVPSKQRARPLHDQV